MKRLVVLLALVLGLASLVPLATAQAGASASCSVSPHNGPPGTTFAFACSGFSPNTYVNIWTVDPSAVAQNGSAVLGAPDSIKTDSAGNAAFVWTSPGGQSLFYSNSFYVNYSVEFGTWTWYVNELCYGKPCIVGSAAVHIDGVPVSITGAALSVSPDQGYVGETTFTITGHGFTPLQPVSLWYSLPSLCDASSQIFSASAARVGDITADASGSFSTSFFLPGGFCLGRYGMTAREVRSARGAIAEFKLKAKPISPTYGDSDTLIVSPNTINAAATVFQYVAMVSGSGYQPGEVVSCWITRPDSAVAEFPDLSRYGFDAKANASGQFSASMTGGDLSSLMGFSGAAWSAQSGTHRITCRGNASGITQLGSFLVVGTMFDP